LAQLLQPHLLASGSSSGKGICCLMVVPHLVCCPSERRMKVLPRGWHTPDPSPTPGAADLPGCVSSWRLYDSAPHEKDESPPTVRGYTPERCTPFEIASRTPSPFPVGRHTQANRHQPQQKCVNMEGSHMKQPHPSVLFPRYLISPIVQEFDVNQSCAWRRSCSRKRLSKGMQNQGQHNHDDKQQSETKPHKAAKQNSGGKQQPDAKQPMKQRSSQADTRNKNQEEQVQIDNRNKDQAAKRPINKGSKDQAAHGPINGGSKHQAPQGPIKHGSKDQAPQVGQSRAETTQKNLSVEALLVVPSFGSFGHPHTCGKPCKYFWKGKGCKDGSSCTWCHLCEWRRVRSSASDMSQIMT